MSKPDYFTMTVGELRQRLAGLPDDAEINFGGLSFYRIKKRGDNYYQFEFNETVAQSPEGRLGVQDHRD